MHLQACFFFVSYLKKKSKMKNYAIGLTITVVGALIAVYLWKKISEKKEDKKAEVAKV